MPPAPQPSSPSLPNPAPSAQPSVQSPLSPNPVQFSPPTQAQREKVPASVHSKKPWIGAMIGIVGLTMVIVAMAYLGGFLSFSSNNEQLNGSAEEQAPQTLEQTANQNPNEQLKQSPTEQTQEDVYAITQTIPNACPQGQVMDPLNKSCTCDINNNYFEIPDAYAQPTVGTSSAACSTCLELSNQIIKLGQSNDPADLNRKNELQSIADKNNCTPCAIFDDQISEASQNKQWDKFFQFAVKKANDKTCGRQLVTCDSLKWQILFLNDLRNKAGKDPQTSPQILQNLEDTQQPLTEDLGNNAECYDLQNLCAELKITYGTVPKALSTQQVVSVPIATTPLIGKNFPMNNQQSAPGSSQETMQTTEQYSTTSQNLSNSEQVIGQQLSETQKLDLLDGSLQNNFDSVPANQLFDQHYYLLHCPVEEQTQSKGIKRTPTISP